jgi:hypothetical protein
MDIMGNGYRVSGTPWFYGKIGLSYEIWSRRMEVCLQEHGYDVWKSVVS